MKAGKIAEAIGFIDERWLELTETMRTVKGSPARRRPAWIKWAAAAAGFCVCLMAAAAVYTANVLKTGEDADALMTDGGFYYSAEGTDPSPDRAPGTEGYTVSSSVVTCGDYTYEIADREKGVDIYSVTGETPVHVGTIDFFDSWFRAEYMFLEDNRLVLGGYCYEEDWLPEDCLSEVSLSQKEALSGGAAAPVEFKCIQIRIYDLGDPLHPALAERYVERGVFGACYMAEGQLCVAASDGVYLKDENREPCLMRNGKTEMWEEHESIRLEINVPGWLTTVIKIQADTGEITDKAAFYGPVTHVYHGGDWMALETDRSPAGLEWGLPAVYFLDLSQTITCIGKADVTEQMKLDTNPVINAVKRLFGKCRAVQVMSVDREGDIFRLVGTILESPRSDGPKKLFAMTADIKADRCAWICTKDCGWAEDTAYWQLMEAYWEPDRVILNLGFMERNEEPGGGSDGETYRREERLVFGEFTPGGIVFYSSDLCLDYVDSFYNEDGNWESGGNPLGHFSTLVPVGNGLFIRAAEKRDALCLYDLSDSRAPRLLGRSKGALPWGWRYTSDTMVYDDGRFGIKCIDIGEDEGGRETPEYRWQIYDADAGKEDFLTLLKEADMPSGTDRKQ